ncbi:chloride channel protein [Flavobacterium faecale]|uniref:Chloride channel protein n=1 Tax=Flavobacterium faecale TaxID=1355330 RepID=A0A2S1LDN6_9FLAO|nr:voltage-gated chloride channel family protein [Flavobacterium faecale]AWG21854.1 chloride channel protein [Flavobacterium faecale]
MLEKVTTTLPIMLKWLFICVLIGIFSGSASAFFLVTLEWVTQVRIQNSWIIWLLPFGGLIIGLGYHYYGGTVVRGNNLLLEEYDNPKTVIPLKMAPFVLVGTLITHLFGGSAGREGTAVQMGGAIADQFQALFKLENIERRTLIVMGISAGFASIFGTPWAGALFAIEVLYCSKIDFKTILLSFIVAFVAYFTVEVWAVKHTHYSIPEVPSWTPTLLMWAVVASIYFGFAAMAFSRTTHFWGRTFSKYISYPPLRPVVGGLVLVLAIHFFNVQKFVGLGVPVIVEAFNNPSANFDFLLKILFTGFTLGCGFKGGEVTPLFFVGATLGSALSMVVPLPIALLAGMGFVAVFSGATHTPIACTAMGLELFGMESGWYIALACGIAYLASGSIGIYSSQNSKGVKYHLYERFRKRNLKNL